MLPPDNWAVAAPMITMAIDSSPPSATEMPVSMLDAASPSASGANLPRTEAAWRNRLYGTTVVPISAIAVNRLSAGRRGMNPARTALQSTSITARPPMNASDIASTSAISSFSSHAGLPIITSAAASAPVASASRAGDSVTAPSSFRPAAVPLILPA